MMNLFFSVSEFIHSGGAFILLANRRQHEKIPSTWRCLLWQVFPVLFDCNFMAFNNSHLLETFYLAFSHSLFFSCLMVVFSSANEASRNEWKRKKFVFIEINEWIGLMIKELTRMAQKFAGEMAKICCCGWERLISFRW